MTFRRCSALAFAALLALSACDSAEVGEIVAVQAVETLEVPMRPEPFAFRIGPYFRHTGGQRLAFAVESSSPAVSATTTNDTLWVAPVGLGPAEVRLRVSDDAGHHLSTTIPVRVVPRLTPCFPEPGMEQRDYFPIHLGNRWTYSYQKSSRDWDYQDGYEEHGDLTLEVASVDCFGPNGATYELERSWTGTRRSWNMVDPEGSEVIEPVSGSGTWTLTESEGGMLTLAHYDDPFPRYFAASAEAMPQFSIDSGHSGSVTTYTTITLERDVGLHRLRQVNTSSNSSYSMSMELSEAILE